MSCVQFLDDSPAEGLLFCKPASNRITSSAEITEEVFGTRTLC